MIVTRFIGQPFLSWFTGDYTYNEYFFYGANQINNNSWQIHFDKEEVHNYSYRNLTPIISLNIEVGSTLRIPGYYIYIHKDGNVSNRSDSSLYYDKGQHLVSSVKFIDIGRDFIKIEYDLAN